MCTRLQSSCTYPSLMSTKAFFSGCDKFNQQLYGSSQRHQFGRTEEYLVLQFSANLPNQRLACLEECADDRNPDNEMCDFCDDLALRNVEELYSMPLMVSLLYEPVSV